MGFTRYNTPTVEEKIDREQEEIYIVAAGSAPIGVSKAACFDASGDLQLADTGNASCKGRFAGIAKNSGNAGDYVNLQSYGEFEDNSFNFPPSSIGGKLFYTNDGSLIADLSIINADLSANHFQIIGKVLSNKKILIKEEPAVTK